MHVVAIERADHPFHIDVCRNCQMIWLDAGEAGDLPCQKEAAGKAGRLHPDTAEAVAPMLAEAERLKASASWPQRELPSGDMPDNALDVLLTYLGFPVEENAPVTRRRPYITWAVMLLCALATLGPMLGDDLGQMVKRYGFLPSNPWRDGGATLLTSFFLHGGLLHLISNLWFLRLTGDNCEDILGGPRYLGLLAAGAISALALHAMLDPRADVPLVGASGGISALLAFYALALPKVRLTICLRLGWYPWWVSMSAMSAMLIWLALQFIGVILQISGFGSTSNLGHLGGFAAGLCIWLLFRKQVAPATGQQVLDRKRREPLV